ncbi:hypothetical protein RHSIM_Rhsim13G0165500 [Rhododendron simsii]|uniref:SWIM-type domain-containing protein n=1 Tax=Rhododendron simsii TaxID=118357 RepID=A0A834FZL7_RHOSS|nr:hypothetical protein RHSIM_Rhsim13G0165500 [Rhododendron simsii]
MKPEYRCATMSTTPQKKLMCFCYSGGERMVNVDGVLGKYSGGVSEATVIEEGISFDELVTKVCSRMDISHEGKTLFYSTSRDKSKHLRIRDEDGVSMLFHLNDDEVDIYVQEETLIHVPCNISSRESNLLSCSPSTGHGGTSSRNEGSLAVCHEMGLVPYSQQRGEDILTGDGQLFDNPSLFKKAVMLFSALNKFTFKYLDNSRSYYRLVCVIDGCPWKLTARAQGKSELIRVIKLNNQHLHTAHDTASFKPRIRAKEMGMIFKDKLLVQPNLLPRSICNDYELAFHSPLTYSQGWRTKERARKLISGPISMTYHLVPWMCERLIQSIPNTRAVWTSNADGKFCQLFVAYGCSITGFLLGCRPMLFIDACFLTGPYRGSCLSAVAYDANDQLFPVAYAVVSSENYEDWLWFMQNLKETVGDKPIVLVTDRNMSLLRAVKEVFGEEFNAWCVRHVKENFSKFATGKGLRGNPKISALDLFTKIAYARDERLYGVYMTKLFGVSPELAKWVEDNGPQHWSNAFFRHRRWNKLYTNIAESFNNWILKLRDLDIIQFMKGHVNITSDILFRRKMEVTKWHPLPVGHNVEKKIKEIQLKSQGLTCRQTSPTEFLVYNGDWKSHAVHLHTGTCSCLLWQMKGIPCKHVVRAIQGTPHNIYNLVDPLFRVEAQLIIYTTVMSPVPLHDMPSSTDMVPHVNDIQFGCDLLDIATSSSTPMAPLMPPVAKRPAGQPKKKRIESQFQDKQTNFCGLCHEPGHNRTTCKSPLLD